MSIAALGGDGRSLNRRGLRGGFPYAPTSGERTHPLGRCSDAAGWRTLGRRFVALPSPGIGGPMP